MKELKEQIKRKTSENSIIDNILEKREALKTLKDIDKERKKYLWSQGKIIKELKQEAIKWLKEMDITKSVDYCDGMIDFIVNFFNITDEDLE